MVLISKTSSTLPTRKNVSGTRIDIGKGANFPKFLAFLNILCFERRCRKQNTVARLKSKDLPAPSGSSPAGGQWCPAPHLKSVPPNSCLPPGLLRTSNIVFNKCGPLVFFGPHPLRNPGDGPGLNFVG